MGAPSCSDQDVGEAGTRHGSHARREDRLLPLRFGANPLVQQDDRPGVPRSGGSALSRTGNGSNWGTDRQSSAPAVPEHTAQYHLLAPTNDPVPSGNRQDPGTGVALCGPCSCSTRSQWPSSSLRARRGEAVSRIVPPCGDSRRAALRGGVRSNSRRSRLSQGRALGYPADLSVPLLRVRITLPIPAPGNSALGADCSW